MRSTMKTWASRLVLVAPLVALAMATCLASVGCGGAAPAASALAGGGGGAGSGGSGGDTPAERCLAVAGAKRARRPDEPAKVTVQHVLVKYAGAKKAPATVTRTREQACLRAEEARAKLEQGSSFADVVNAYSEEPGAATRGGSLGPIERAHVVPPFADAAFELRAGEVSHVVETDYGFHIILRTE
jgi:NIMA-interacting peptidyl-prolyl cis-trans isomerase 1